MHKLTKTILRILDGAPPPDRQKQRGQSLLEMAFITPLLIIMFIGIVEIGWYANHYMILLETTRVGARAGTVLTGDLGPLNWTNAASLHPVVYETDADLNWASASESLGDMPSAAAAYRSCAPGTPFGFYNFIACSMLDSLEPLTIKGRDPATTEVVERIVYSRGGTEIARIPVPDDIVISLFSLAAVNNARRSDIPTPEPTNVSPPPNPTPARELVPNSYDHYVDIYSRTYDFDATGADYPPGFQLIVIGRYPTNANECNVYYAEDHASGNDLVWYDDVRDPFDYIPNGVRDFALIAGRFMALEEEGMDTGPEMQRGFVWTGQHRVRGVFDEDGREMLCWGSEFTTEDVERFMNSPSFLGSAQIPPEPRIEDYVNPAQWQSDHDDWVIRSQEIRASHEQRMSFLPSQGLVLVEIYWRHDLLLNFPLLTPLVGMFADTNNVVINVWAAFPVPAVEPNVVFDLP